MTADTGPIVAEFRDAVHLWLLRPTQGATLLVEAATSALVAGLDSPTLRELAGKSPEESGFVVAELVEATCDELGIDAAGTREEVEMRATRAMCRRLLQGGLTPRELAA